MRKILIFAGTTEGRQLSECLSKAGMDHTVCVATEYGEIVLGEHSHVAVHRGRMDGEAMLAFLREGGYAAVVDATHPYATIVTENIKKAAKDAGTVYLRLKRDTGAGKQEDGITLFDDNASCAAALAHVKGNILLTTGSKELAVYCKDPALKERLYVRVLPGMESLTLCREQGIAGRRYQNFRFKAVAYRTATVQRLRGPMSGKSLTIHSSETVTTLSTTCCSTSRQPRWAVRLRCPPSRAAR